MKWTLVLSACLACASLLAAQGTKPGNYRPTIDKGLAWLAAQQAKDGSWSEKQGINPAANTASAGMALLADGNTLAEGKYRANVRLALNWFLALEPMNAKYGDALVDPEYPGSTGRYMMEHGLGMSFLAKLYGE
ncbi:MAG TPA: hypothetical protein VFV87_10450, partial [Pirellulaceae bacterium]|nr:hypothetical protein [Pirellulaceae bacterium]